MVSGAAEFQILPTVGLDLTQGFLEQIARAVEEGADVRGYYLWSLLDNFEWNVATDCRFGLLHVDFETQERIWKDSAYWYRDVIARNGVD